MDVAEIARMIFSLAIVLGLIGLLVVAARKFGPETFRQWQVARAERRLSVIESLTLDPSRRLVLVRFDQEERLILLGEGRLLAAQSAAAIAPAMGKDE
jgi:flagellar protein FliO/FliZ